MKTICMYTAQLHLAGGIESVVRDLYTILPMGGIHVVAACEYGKADWIADSDYLCLKDVNRETAWQEFIAKNRVDVVVFNYTARAYEREVIRDITLIQSLGVPCVKMIHSSFPSSLLLSGDERDIRDIGNIARHCKAVFTVSQIDAKFWTALGHKAICIQNPIHVPKKNADMSRQDGREPGVTNLVWVGRQCEPKQPSTALAAFAQACIKTDKARLTMIGGSEKGWKPLEKEAKRLGVADKVKFLAARSDITDIWNMADVHLLTSITESFCLVLAEAKSMGIPTIMFDLPYLELTASGKGLVVLPQGDIKGMTDAIVRLVEDKALCKKLGREARESLANFNHEKVISDWHRALDALVSGEGFAEVSEDAHIIAAQLAFAWNRYCDKNLWLVRMEENARRCKVTFRYSARLLFGVVNLARKIRSVASSGK